MRAMPGTSEQSDFRVERIPPISGLFISQQNENLVSEIIKISHVDENFKVSRNADLSIKLYSNHD